MMKQPLAFLLLLVSNALFALNAPVLTSPANHLTNAYTRQTFYWNSVSDAGSYQIQLDTTTKFNSPLLRSETWSATSTTTFSVKMTDFYFRTHYYWRVRAISKTDEEVTSAWSEVWDLTTVAQATLVSPNNLDETATYFPTQTLTWKNSRGCIAYTIETDTVPTFNSPAKTRETWSHSATEDETKSCEVRNLYLGKMNYWRLKVYNKNDSSDWSDTYRFHTLSKATANYPKDCTNALTQQNFEWKFLTGLTNVIIQIDTTKTFNSPALRVERSSGSSQSYCYTTISNLYFGKTHYWRVRSYHQRDTTQWSDVLSFTTYNFCTLSSPADSAINQYTSGQVKWKYHSGVSRYQVQMDTVPTFDSPFLKNQMESASSDDYAYYSFSQLNFGKWYYWRVRECHAKDTSQWSVVRHFKTYRHCNLKTDPQDSATGVSTSPALYFEYSRGVSYYQQQIDTVPTFDSPAMESQITSGSSGSSYNYHQFEDIYFGKTYYRRVRECLPNDTTDWSPTHCFTTIERGAYSTNSSYPSIAKGATGQSITPKLYYCYRSYIDSVEIQIDTTLNFDSPLLESIRVQEASSQYYAWEIPRRTLLYGTTYYWRIRNSHSRDVSDWTFPRYFTTLYQLSSPTLSSPANQTMFYNDSVVHFTWNTCEDATHYVFQLSDDGQFNTYLHQEILTTTSTSIVPPSNSNLYWRVQAINALGRSPWSKVWGVNTKGIATDMETVSPEGSTAPVKVLKNNQIFIIKNGVWTTITGISL